MNRLKQSFVLEKSIQFLSILHKLRKPDKNSRTLKLKLEKIDSFIHKCLEISEYYDYLNSNLNLDLRLFKNFTDKNILKELLNRSHSEGDIFLYADSNVFQQGDIIDIRITTYRKLLERLAGKFLDNPSVSSVLMSKEYREFLRSKIHLYILKDYKAMSLTEIPPYRIWDKKNKKMIYFKAIPIDSEINKLEGVMSRYNKALRQISKPNMKFLKDYYRTWWLEYKSVVNKKREDIANHFQYFEGVNIKLALTKTFLTLPNVFEHSDMALCVGKRANKSESCDIKIDDKICSVLYLDDHFDGFDDVCVDLNFDFNSYKRDFKSLIHSSLEHDIGEELLYLFKTNHDDSIFRIFSNKMLSLMGIHVAESDGKVGVQYSIHFKKKMYNILRYNKNDKMDVNKIEEQRKKKEVTIILISTLIPDVIKKKYYKDNEIHLMDINDFLTMIWEPRIEYDAIIDEIIYPFLKEKLKHKKIDMRLYRAQKLLSRLENCPKGIKGWRTFEDICIEIIEFVLRDSFRNFKRKTHSRSYKGLDIRDEIVQNTGKTDFWSELRSDYNAKNIVFEFKNLSEELGKDEFIQTSDYLKKESLGRVGIIFSRKGLSKGGSEEQRQLLIHDKKLILVLSESDLINLVNKKLRYEEPEQILESLKFELETSI